MSKGTVQKAVLIDDSDIDLFIQKRFLEVYHFSKELVLYNSAKDAFNELKTMDIAPEVIFLDLNMPEADGFSFLKNFKGLPSGITRKSKIVVLTSSESNIDRDYVLSFNNVAHFITKPLKQSDIEDLKIIFNN